MLNFIKQWLVHFRLIKKRETLRGSLKKIVFDEHYNHDNSLSDEEKFMIRHVLTLDQITVADIMVPRADIVSIPRDISFDRLRSTLAQHPYTRLVVYHNTLDEVKGFIHVKDVYQLVDAKNFSIKSIIRKPLLVVSSLPVLDLLLLIRRTQIPMAIVIDEFGGVDGLVSTWDILQVIVGNIEESHDPEISSLLTELSNGEYEADARLPIEEFSELFGIELTEDEKQDDIDTVGGLIVSLAGRVPDRRELIEHPEGVEFEILEANPRRVMRVKIRRKVILLSTLADSE